MTRKDATTDGATPVVMLTVGQLRALVSDALADFTPPPAPAEVLTQAEVAELLRCSTRLVRELVKTRGLPEFRAGDAPRHRRAAVMQWIKEQEGRQ